jgi:alpha 1,3-glucosidase
MACFQPFFRSHAHHDSPRREPYLFDEPFRSSIRNSIKTRYRLLPYIYTTFFEASISGNPIMKPIFYDNEFSNDNEALNFGMTAKSFGIGNSVLVFPVLNEHQREIEVYLPRSNLPYNLNCEKEISDFESKSLSSNFSTGIWYSLLTDFDHDEINSVTKIKSNRFVFSPGYHTFKTSIEYIPVFVKGGSVIPIWRRYRRSSFHQLEDPISLVVYPNEEVNRFFFF